MDRLAIDMFVMMAADGDVVVVLLMGVHLPLVVARSGRYYRTFVVEKIMIRKHESFDDDNDMWLASFAVVVTRGCSWHASFDPISSPSSPIVARHETCVRPQSSVCDFPSPCPHSMSRACRVFDRVDAAAPVCGQACKSIRIGNLQIIGGSLTFIRTIMLR
jgi:hypothetical protein